ncbi:MAG: NHL repeat-containing protein [bacterium]
MSRRNSRDPLYSMLVRFKFTTIALITLLFFLLVISSGVDLGSDGVALAERTNVRILRLTHRFDITGFENSKFNQPSDVEITRDRIYVLDGVNDRIAVFDKKGTPLFTFGKSGSDPGELNSPLGFAIDSKNRIYVADSGNHRIEVFDINGVFLSNIPLIKDKYGIPSDPTCIAINEQLGYLIIADNDNHRLLIYTVDGKFKREVGEVGYLEGQFRYPFGIDCDSDGNIYVVDVVNTRVQVFDPQGLKVLRVIGEWGIERGQYFRPQGIDLDAQNRVYVTESFKNIGVIQVFNPDGSFRAVLGNRTGEKIRFDVPVDIEIDDENTSIYICEMYASKISVYQLLDSQK